MPNFRLNLNDNLDARVPSNQEVIYRRSGGLADLQWWVQAHSPNPLRNTSVPEVTSGADLVNQASVTSRVLRMHYPGAPNTVDHQIGSVQRV
jgi:hypothetical protein